MCQETVKNARSSVFSKYEAQLHCLLIKKEAMKYSERKNGGDYPCGIFEVGSGRVGVWLRAEN